MKLKTNETAAVGLFLVSHVLMAAVWNNANARIPAFLFLLGSDLFFCLTVLKIPVGKEDRQNSFFHDVPDPSLMACFEDVRKRENDLQNELHDILNTQFTYHSRINQGKTEEAEAFRTEKENEWRSVS